MFLDQSNPEADVNPGEGQSFNSGGLAAMSAKLWDVNDVGLIDRIVGDVIAQFDGAIARATGGAVTSAVNRDRLFVAGFSDGGFMAHRMLKESVAGTLSYPFRGVFAAAGAVGGWALNRTYLGVFPFLPNRFAESGVAEISAPSTASRKVVFMTHGTQDHIVSGLGDVTDSVYVVTGTSLQDGAEAANADLIGWNYDQDKATLVYPTKGAATNGHSVGSSAWWSFFASANAWSAALSGAPSIFPVLTPIAVPPTVSAGELGGVDWRVRLWSVSGLDHAWPTVSNAAFEGLIVAWLFFEQFAP